MRVSAQDASTDAIARLEELEIDTCRVQSARRDEACKTAPDNGNLGVHHWIPRTEIMRGGMEGNDIPHAHDIGLESLKPYAVGSASIVSKTRAV
jgi:hypothetical protein